MNQYTDPFLFQTQEESEFNLKEVFYKYLYYWKWFLISIVLSMAVAFFYLRTKTPLYNIHSSILIKDDKKVDQGDMLKQLNIFSGTKVVDNEMEILKSNTLMENVIRNLNLNISYYSEERFESKELYRDNCPLELRLVKENAATYSEPFTIELLGGNKVEIGGREYLVNKNITTPFGTFYLRITGKNTNISHVKVSLVEVSNLAAQYIESLKIEPSSKMSSVLLLNIENSIPQRGKDILNSLIEEYNKSGLEDKNKSAYNTLAFIEKRLELVSADLLNIEKQVQDFKTSEGITDIGAESKLFLESVKENDAQINQVQIQETVLQNIYQYISESKNGGTVPATFGISDPVLVSLVAQLSELELKKEQTIKLVKEDNPIVISLNNQIRNTKGNIKENVLVFQKNLSLTKEKLRKQNATLEGFIRSVPNKERKLLDISRQQAIKNDLYVFLLQKREETSLSYASAVSDSRVIDNARSSGVPIKPVKRNVYLVFGILGIFIPIGILYIKDLLNNKIKRRVDIEKNTSLPILAEVSFIEHNEPIVIGEQSKSIIAEQIRSLRTNISFLSVGKKIKTILFTSSLSGEGKSFISLNLGVSLAMIGKKTVVLEFDMRKPKLHKELGISNEKGLSDYLIGSVELKDILHPVKQHEGYFIITCGKIPPNPVELLVNGRLAQLFDELAERFDQIIVDAPPVAIVTDAQILGQYADVTMYLLRYDYTPKEYLKYVNSLSKDKKLQNINLIFNGITQDSGYGYGYGYGYYQ